MNPEDEIVVGTENTDPTDNELDGEAELLKVLESLKDDNDDEDLDDTDDNTDELDDDTTNEELDSEDNFADDDSDEAKGQKREQSKEENARFAAERRQRELDDKVQSELERLKQEAPEFILAKQLSEQMGIPAEQIIEQMKEAQLQKEAQDLKIPVEFLRKQQAAEAKAAQLEDQLNQMSFQNWQTRLQSEGTLLQKDFPMLTREDISQAESYILQVARNVNMPLEQAVFALHGRKIIEGKVIDKTQDTLAAESGRKKKVPLAPNNAKPAATTTLTQDEKYIAKALGMSDADYLKYK